MYSRRDRQFVPRVGPVLRRGTFPLIGGGRTTLTLVHAGSVARGAVLAARTDRAAGRVYHLTNDFPVDTRTLVRCAAEGLGVRVRGVLTRDNPFSSARARAELGWSPDVRPETALTEAFRWWHECGERDTGKGR